MNTALAERAATDSAALDRSALGRRWIAGSVVVAFVLAFIQAPGLIVADTKYDLTQNPLGFLARAAHLWSSQAPMGQVQNQAYGYFFPHGAFFAVGRVLGMPAWITQRVWWVLLLLAGFWGIVRLAEALGIGSRGSRVLAAVVFALSPRVLTTLGSISSESLPMMLAPWVLLGVVRWTPRGALRSAVAVALMGAVNAVATVAAVLPAVLWWLAHRPDRRWWRFTAWWLPSLALATCWWIVPLLLLGRVSPPFLDYIESAGTTTQWASLAEVLRGTDSWTPFVSPERIAGAVLVTQPAAVLATGLLAAAGMAGLAMRSMPVRGRLVLILFAGLAGLTAGYVGGLGSPVADTVRTFLDGSGAPLRNVHKLEPLIRIPLVLGLAHLLGRVPLPSSAPRHRWRAAFAHPERDPLVALAGLVLVALTLSTSLAWTGRLAPRGAYDAVPRYWQQTADWLAEHAADSRALVVPGAPFGSQVWGLTRDEPLQALASTRWAVRDAIPLTPPGTIRAMDAVQRLIAEGRPSAGLAATLRGQGIGYLVLRNDLDPDTARSTRPVLAHQAIEGSPGISRVAEFGGPIGFGASTSGGQPSPDGLVVDEDLRPDYPAVQIYRVSAPAVGTPADIRAGPGAGDTGLGAYTVPLSQVPVVAGGPEVVSRLAEVSAATGNAVSAGAASGDVAGTGPVLLAADAARAGVPPGPVTVTDTPVDRETDFGRVDDHSSAIRAPGDPRRTLNRVPDYPVPDTPSVEAAWSGARVTVSGSAADATQLGGVAPGSPAAAAVDGDPATSWLSNGLESAVGQWLQLDLDTPVRAGLLHLTSSAAAVGSPVKWVEISTAAGTTAARIDQPGKPFAVALPPGSTSWVRITAKSVVDGSAGTQFGIAELTLDDYGRGEPHPVPIGHRTVLPPVPAGTTVTGWDLGQELPGRGNCVDAPDRVRCSIGLGLAAEEPSTFQRTLSVPADTTVAPELTVQARPGPDLDALLTQPDRVIARGPADVGDPRGSAFAATDGDPRTSWTAPSDTVRDPAGPKPTLTLELPEPTLVTGLEIDPSRGELPAHPVSVSVNLGAGPQLRQVSRGRIVVHPFVTDRIELSVATWHGVLDRTALGFAQEQPPGFAEVRVYGPGGVQVGAPAAPDRPVTVDCAHGPVVSIAGRDVHLSVTAPAADFRNGSPVAATPCDAPAGGVALPAGTPDVTVRPGTLFTVSRLRLPVRVFPPPEGEKRAQAAQLLVLPLSENSGWSAADAGGRRLDRVVVNGWQQGWLVPAGTSGPITVAFADDRWYRLGIFGGLALLLPLFGFALRRRPDAPVPPPSPWCSPAAGIAGVCATAAVVSGPVGLAVGALGCAARLFIERSAAVLAAVAGLGTALSAAVLSTGPWRSAGGYLGHSAWAQLPALIAVVAVGVAALPVRYRSQRRAARRAGSSTSA